MSPFSKYLKQLRLNRGFSQKDFAHYLGYEQSYLSAVERSQKGPPRREFVERLIRKLNLTEVEQSEVHRALRASKRQVSLPCAAAEDEYLLLRELEPQLGRLAPIQVQLIRIALSLPAQTG